MGQIMTITFEKEFPDGEQPIVDHTLTAVAFGLGWRRKRITNDSTEIGDPTDTPKSVGTPFDAARRMLSGSEVPSDLNKLRREAPTQGELLHEMAEGVAIRVPGNDEPTVIELPTLAGILSQRTAVKVDDTNG